MGIALLISIVYWSVKNGISPMPTTPYVRRELFKILPELPQTSSETSIAELGAGWGSLLIPLAKHYPNCRIVGYETSPIPYGITWLRLKLAKISNATVLKRNFLKEPLGSFQLFVCYLYPGCMQKLAVKLEQELRHEAWIVSHTFALPGWTPIQSLCLDDLYHTPIYLYHYNGRL